jgi:hypothetical protein
VYFAKAMSSAAEVSQEVKHVNAFLESRQSLCVADDAVAKNMVQSLVKKINLMRSLGPEDALCIYESLKVCSFLVSSKLAEQIQVAVDKRLVEVPDETCNLPVMSQKPQLLTSLANYLTNKDWAALKASSLEEMKWVMIKRLRSLGVKS